MSICYIIENSSIQENKEFKYDKLILATGLTEENTDREGFETVCVMVDSRSKHEMLPGMKFWKIKAEIKVGSV